MKRFLKRKLLPAALAASILLSGMPMAAHAADDVTLSDGLVGYWNFDQGASTTVPNQASEAFAGTLNGTGISIVEEGTLSGGMLHMTGVDNSYMNIPALLNSATTSFSISFWIQLDPAINTGRSQNINILQQDGAARTLLYYNTANQYGTFVNSQDVLADYTPPLGAWHHVVLTSDADAKTVQFYINGALVKEAPSGSGAVNALTALRIGAHKNGNGPVKGDMDEIRYYNRVISAPEAGALYRLNAETPSPEKGLVGYWNFDQEPGTTVQNQAGNAFTGELVGSGVSIEKEGTLSGGSLRMEGDASSFLRIPGIMNAGAEDFSIALWVRYDEDAHEGKSRNLNLLHQDGAGRTLLYLMPADEYGTYIDGNDSLRGFTAKLGAWHHVVLTSNHTTKNVQLFVNGQLVKENVLKGTAVDAVTGLLVGAHKNAGSGDAVKGNADELRYYNRVITTAEAAELYEEHALVVERETLNASIAAAQALMELGYIGPDETVYRELSAQIGLAQAVLENQAASIDAVQEASAALQVKMDAFQDTVDQIPIEIKVNPNRVLQKIPRELFGINHRYYDNALNTWDPEKGEVKAAFDQYAKDAKFGSVRYPGGTVANLFRWKDSIGPADERPNTIHGLPNNKTIEPNFGLDEAARYISDDLASSMIYMYGMGNGSAQDAADLVEYLNCEVGENPNGGIDWAQVRADNGHPEPYNVTHFELGNEMQQEGSQDYWMAGRQGSRTLFDAYLYGSKGKDGTGGDANAIKFTIKADGYRNNSERTATYVVDYDNWNENTRKSNGSPNLVKYIRYAPVVKGSATIQVAGETWTQVDTLDGAGAQNVYTLDEQTGKLTFGDGVNGNIPASGAEIRAGYTSIQDGFVDLYDAMKAVDPDVKVYCGMESKALIDKLAADNENRWDGLQVHPYSRQGFSDSDPLFYEKAMERNESAVGALVQSFVDYIAQKGFTDKKVTVSEYGIYPSSNPLLGSQTNALYNAKALFSMARIGVAYANRHCMVDYPAGDALGPGLQAVIQVIKNTSGGVDFVSTPSARFFEMINSMTGDQVLEDELSRNVKLYKDVNDLETLSSKDADGNLYLALINLDKDTSLNVFYNIDGVDLSGKTVEIWSLSGDSFDAVNTVADPDHVDIEKTTRTIHSAQLDYTIGAHTIAMIKVPAGEAPAPADKAQLEEKVTEAAGKTEKDYTPESWKVFADAKQAAETVLANPDATQQQVDDAYRALSAAIEALIPVVPVEADRSELKKVIEEAKLYQLDQFVDDQKAKDGFRSALSAAEEMLAKENATQTEVDGAVLDLLIGMSGLRLRADKSSLEEWLNTLKEIDLTQYTEESALRVRGAISRAEALLAQDLPSDQQFAIEELAAELKQISETLQPAGGEQTPDAEPPASEDPGKEEPGDVSEPPPEPETEPESKREPESGQEKASSEDSSASEEKSANNPAPSTGDAPYAAVAMLGAAAAGVVLLLRRRSGC